MKNSLFTKLIILLFALPALACALTGGDEPTATPPPVATAEVAAPTTAPTDVPPTPTIEAEPTADVTANFVSYTSDETGITVEHPSDWAVQDFFVLVIATDETLFDAPGAIQEGAGVVFASGEDTDFVSTDPIELVEEAIIQFELSEDATIVEGPTAVTIQGQEAAIAKVEGTPEETGTPLAGLAVVVVNENRIVVGLGITPQESEAEFLPVFEAMFNTIEVGEPVEVEEPESTGSLPNADGATMLSVGDIFASNLDENGNRDFIFNGQAGESVLFSIEPIDDEIDLVMEIFDADQNSLIRQDEGFSGDGEEILFTPSASGEYFIRVFDFFGNIGSFNIEVQPGFGEGSVDPTATRLEPNQLTADALTGESKQFVFSATADQQTTLLLIPTDNWDPTMTILGPTGSIVVSEVDEGFSGESETITFTPQSDGEYVLVVDAFGLVEGGFNMFLVDPAFAFTAEGTVEAEQSQDYQVCVPMNSSVAVVVIPDDDFDTVINISGPDGAELIDQVDDGASGDSEAVVLTEGVNPDADYPVIVSVAGWAGQGGSYMVIITSTSGTGVVIDGC